MKNNNTLEELITQFNQIIENINTEFIELEAKYNPNKLTTFTFFNYIKAAGLVQKIECKDLNDLFKKVVPICDNEVYTAITRAFDESQNNQKFWLDTFDNIETNTIFFLTKRISQKQFLKIKRTTEIDNLIFNYYFLKSLTYSIHASDKLKSELFTIKNAIELAINNVSVKQLKSEVEKSATLRVGNLPNMEVYYDFTDLIFYVQHLENLNLGKEILNKLLKFANSILDQSILNTSILDILNLFDFNKLSIQQKANSIYFILQTLLHNDVINITKNLETYVDLDDPDAIKNFDKKVKTRIKSLGLL